MPPLPFYTGMDIFVLFLLISFLLKINIRIQLVKSKITDQLTQLLYATSYGSLNDVLKM